MSAYDLPDSFTWESPQGGHISGHINGDALVVTIADDETREEAWIELAEAHLRGFIEGLTALLLDWEEAVGVDIKDKDRDDNAESISVVKADSGLTFELVLWGEASKPVEERDFDTFSVSFDAFAARDVYVQFNAIALRRGLAYR